MKTNTTTPYSDRQYQLARIAKALAHPARIAILEVLIRKGTCLCGEVVDELPLSQATVSQHLKAMKSARLIKGEIDGKFSCYCVDPKGCQEAQLLLEGLLETAKRCC